jgi:hypothetical protein
MYVFIVFDFGQTGVVVGHGVQPIESVGARRLGEKNGKDL